MFVSVQELLGYAVFLFVLSVTPGPNNLLVLHASAVGGVRGALPLVLGIALGVHTLLALMALGVIGAVAAAPIVQDVGQLLAGCVLFYLACRIALAAAPAVPRQAAGAMTGFLGGALFQLINPKAWVVVFALAAMFASSGEGLLRPALLFLIGVPVSLTSLLIWAGAGAAARRLIEGEWARRALNHALAAVLLALAAWFAIDGAAGLLARLTA